MNWVTSSRMRPTGLKSPSSQTKALRLRRSVDHSVSQQQEKSRLHTEKCVFARPRKGTSHQNVCFALRLASLADEALLPSPLVG